MKNYSEYHTEDYLTDLFFMDWVYTQDKKAEEFFLKLMEVHPHTSRQVREAKNILLKIKIKKTEVPDIEIEKSWTDFEQIVTQKSIKNTHRRKIFLWSISAAASIALLFLSIHLYNKSYRHDYISMMDQSSYSGYIQDNEIRLFLEDEIWTLKKGQHISCKNGNIMIYETINGKEKIVAQRDISGIKSLNKLIVPHGKQMDLILSDQSKLNINAGSTVIFPSVFDRKEREIFIDGEAFLNVHPDNKHPFKAKTRQMDITVLGTSFNISAYSVDTEQSVVLVSGKVRIDNQEKTFLLKPGQRFRNTCKENIDRVNALDYICWKDGFMKVDNENLKNILKRLERHYDVQIVYDEKQIASPIKYSGKLELTENIRDVFKTIESTTPVTITKENDKYIVNL